MLWTLRTTASAKAKQSFLLMGSELNYKETSNQWPSQTFERSCAFRSSFKFSLRPFKRSIGTVRHNIARDDVRALPYFSRADSLVFQ